MKAVDEDLAQKTFGTNLSCTGDRSGFRNFTRTRASDFEFLATITAFKLSRPFEPFLKYWY